MIESSSGTCQRDSSRPVDDKQEQAGAEPPAEAGDGEQEQATVEAAAQAAEDLPEQAETQHSDCA